MSIEQHKQNRVWAIDALDMLNRFVSDGDIDAPADTEFAEIETNRKNLLEGKYRAL
ncbi:MAG: hypothetical protein IT367_03845, partial [Candidatus Hydrogenedentes bacterium]|nr:hypothetical protein [Candidatus Hydrogenedentota bacterium]